MRFLAGLFIVVALFCGLSPVSAETNAVAVPLPINFVANDTRLTAAGELALEELAEAAAQMPEMTLVGHAAPRGGSHEDNMELSRRRVIAVRNKLVEKGVKARITIEWKGDSEPFDVSVLPGDTLSRDDILQLDDRVEWRRQAQ
jgi:outer membrane protein OmpA-like peptidoglycan-associated protein